MITVDISEVEKISDFLFAMAANTDEALNLLRRTATEMQEDLELQTYPQSAAALESVSLSIMSLTMANDTLQSLKNIMIQAVHDYQENEKKHINALGRMTNREEWLKGVNENGKYHYHSYQSGKELLL